MLGLFLIIIAFSTPSVFDRISVNDFLLVDQNADVK